MNQDHEFLLALAEERADLASALATSTTEDGRIDAHERLADLAELETRAAERPRWRY